MPLAVTYLCVPSDETSTAAGGTAMYKSEVISIIRGSTSYLAELSFSVK